MDSLAFGHFLLSEKLIRYDDILRAKRSLNQLTGRSDLTIKTLCGLFRGSSIRIACKLAGIPKPPGCT